MQILKDFKILENIYVFDQEGLSNSSFYDETLFEKIDIAEKKHFWFFARREKICQIFLKYISPKSRILEIGGGTGFIAKKLIDLGFLIEMSDIHFQSLIYAQKKGIKKLYQFNLLDPPFQNEFDVVCLFDVLEHIDEDIKAINSIKNILKPGGRSILTVPSSMLLWNRDDLIAGHKRRYTKKELQKKFTEVGFKIIHIEYFFILIYPFLFLRKFLLSNRKTHSLNNLYLNKFLNLFCSLLTKIEFAFNKWIPSNIGGSILIVVQRDE